jgi:ATP-binding cassette subfamily F protein uup
LLLVSHDRTFLDNVVTQTLAPEGNGVWKEYVGGYSDWMRQRPVRASTSAEPVAAARDIDAAATLWRANERKALPAKLSYKETRELAELPQRIEALEQEQRELSHAMSGSDYHRLGGERMRQDAGRSTSIETELEAAFERWAELEARHNAAR